MKKRPNRWLVFSSLALQMGILFYGAVRLGSFLDPVNAEKKYFTMASCFLALVASLVLIIKQSKKL